MIPLSLLELTATHHKRSREEMAFNHKNEWRQFEYYYLELGKTFIHINPAMASAIRHNEAEVAGIYSQLGAAWFLVTLHLPWLPFPPPSKGSLAARDIISFGGQSCQRRNAFLCSRSGNIQRPSFFQLPRRPLLHKCSSLNNLLWPLDDITFRALASPSCVHMDTIQYALQVELRPEIYSLFLLIITVF